MTNPLSKSKRGEQAIMGVAIGALVLVVAVIVTLGVAVPIAQSVVSAANLTGINATVATYIVTFLILSVLIAAAFLAIRPMLGGSK